MSLRPVGLEYVTQGGQQFLKTVSQSNQATQQFIATLVQGQQQSSAFGSVITGVFQGVGQQLTAFAVRGAQAVTGWMQSGIALSASMEQAQVAFTTLLGSADEATQFLEQLRDFAAKTPFEFPGLQDASRRLLAFKFSAEEIIPTMTSIGDAVGALGGSAAEIQRVVYGLGQMKAKGRVANEELMQLAELGIPVYQILGDALGKSTKEIQMMVSKGLLPAEQGVKMLLDGFTQLYGGSMQAQAVTFNGLMSTLKDNLGLALQAFSGGAFTAAKSALIDLGNIVGSPAFQNFAKVVGDEIGTALQTAYTYLRTLIGAFMDLMPAISTSLTSFQVLASQARNWGINIVSQLAAGMWQAVKYVVQVIKQIGSVIAGWLRPGSPPAILPDLPAWGTSAVNEWIKGWGHPDLAVFKDLSQTITGVLKSLIDPSTMSEAGLGQMTLSIRDAIGGAVEEFRTLGRVSDEAFSRIADAAGPAGPAIEELARTYFELQEATREVAAAQEELNAVTEAYADQIKPLSDELKALADRKQEIKDAQRLEKLQKDLASGKLDEQEAELARIEIQEIGLQKQLKGVEEERDAAVEAAEAKLKAAEDEARAVAERFALQQAQLEATSQQNDLIQQQIDLIKRLVEEQKRAAEAAAASAAAGGGGGAGGGPGGLGAGLGSLAGAAGAGGLEAGPIAEVAEAVTALGGAVADTKEAYGEWNAQAVIAKQRVDEMMTSVQEFVAPLAVVGATFSTIGSSIATATTPLQAFYATLLNLGVPFETVMSIGTVLQSVFAGVQLAFSNITQVATGFAQQLGLIETPLGNVPTQMQALGGALATAAVNVATFVTNILPLQNVLFAIGAVIGSTVLSSLYGMAAAFVVAAAPVVGLIAGIAALKTAYDTNFLGIQNVVNSVLSGISSLTSSVLGSITGWWQENGAAIAATVSEQWAPIGTQITAIMSIIGAIVGEVLATIGRLWAEHGNEIMTTAMGAFTSVSGMIASILGFVLQITKSLLEAIYGFWVENGDGIMQSVMGMWQFVSGLFTSYSSLVGGIFKTFTALLQGDWDGAWKAIKEALGGALDGIKTMLSGLWNMFSPILDKVWKSFVQWATDMGGDVVGGIVKGIGDNAAKVMTAMVNLAQNALNKAKEFLGIKSPSTVFHWVGGMVDLGLAQGIEQNTSVVANAMKGMFDTITGIARTESESMLKEVTSKLQAIADAALQMRGSLAQTVASGYGFIGGLVPATDKFFGLQEKAKELDEARYKALTKQQEAQIAANEMTPDIDKLREALEAVRGEEAKAGQAVAHYDAMDEAIADARQQLQWYDDDLQRAAEDAEKLGDFDTVASIEAEREVVARSLQDLQRRAELLDRESKAVKDQFGAITDYRKELEKAFEDAAGEQERFIKISEDEEARAAEIQKEREKVARELANETIKQQERERLKFEFEQRLAEVRAKALEMSQTDAAAAQEYLEFETRKLEQEASLRSAILNEESAAKKTQLEEQLKAVMAAQELETQLYVRQAEQRANARKDELAGVEADFLKFLQDLSTRPEYGDIGHQIIRGLGKGITDELTNLQDVLGDVVDTMIVALKQALGISSPAALLAEEIGEPSGEGVLVGFADKLRELPELIQSALAATERMAQPIIQSMAMPSTYSMPTWAMASGGNTTNNNYYNYTPTYGSAPRAPSQDFRIMRAMNTRR